MSVSSEQIEAAKDLFAELGDLSTRKMMGGLCLYQRGTIFAILMADGALWLKGAGDFIDVLEAEGCTRWTYLCPKRQTTGKDAVLDNARSRGRRS